MLQEAAADKDAKATEKSAKVTGKISNAPANKKAAGGKTSSKGKGANKRTEPDDPPPPKLPKAPKVTPQGPAQPTDSSTLQPLVSALTAVVSKLASASTTPTVPVIPAPAYAPPSRAELRNESKHDHTLRQEIRMDELKYIREMKSIFTENPITPASTSATGTPLSTAMSALTPGSNQDMDLNEAWRILSNADSWINADEKDAVLKDQIGASSLTDLSFLDSGDLKVLVGKLKLVQANRLKRALKLV